MEGTVMKGIEIYPTLEATQAEDYCREVIQRWIDRGDGCAVYENHDLGHPNLGHRKYVSYGSPAAQIEVRTADLLPDRLPDIGSEIHWRYRLVGVYQPALLPEFRCNECGNCLKIRARGACEDCPRDAIERLSLPCLHPKLGKGAL